MIQTYTCQACTLGGVKALALCRRPSGVAIAFAMQTIVT